ncbi:GDP-L-fucose synthase family protein [Dysgonomonas alginatilytica]|uniref:GDP-L-fucose synthase family protein n=1 Tax=Dysgonomonas alginatilytica TaxID=1605892 RepID=UPI000D754E2D|nr:GDP-L-fucose synthase [Dysgonomonas alginatilytica]
MDKSSKIYIAGHRGLVGSAILRNLKDRGYNNFILRTHEELDLKDQLVVAKFFEEEKPEYVILAAAKVGGIIANNKYRADFIYENLMIQNNIIHQAYLNKVKKLVFLGSTCIYPKEAPQPMSEDLLLTSPLEYTNEPYAIAKIAGIKMCESYNIQYGTNFLAVMPTNLYGPNDNFDLEKSHVLPALIRKIYLGKCLEENNWDLIKLDLQYRPIENIDNNSSEVDILFILNKYGISRISDQDAKIEIWGSGSPMREFLWSEDMADATIHVMESVNFLELINVTIGKEIRNTHINIGTGIDISIKELALLVKKIIGFKGQLWFNTEKPDGTMKKLTDVSKLHSLGWKHKIEIEEGVELIYNWYKNTER